MERCKVNQRFWWGQKTFTLCLPALFWALHPYRCLQPRGVGGSLPAWTPLPHVKRLLALAIPAASAPLHPVPVAIQSHTSVIQPPASLSGLPLSTHFKVYPS